MSEYDVNTDNILDSYGSDDSSGVDTKGMVGMTGPAGPAGKDLTTELQEL